MCKPSLHELLFSIPNLRNPRYQKCKTDVSRRIFDVMAACSTLFVDIGAELPSLFLRSPVHWINKPKVNLGKMDLLALNDSSEDGVVKTPVLVGVYASSRWSNTKSIIS